jgi:hypothetical protein
VVARITVSSCSGSTVKVTGINSSGETRYYWYIDSTNVTSSAPAVTKTFANDGAHVIVLKVTGPGGSDNTAKTVTTPCAH